MRLPYLVLAAATLAACAHQSTTPNSAGDAVPTRQSGMSTRGLAYTPAPASERELTVDEQVQQVLNRLAFGPRPEDAAAVRAMGVDRWIDLQLHPDRIDDRALDASLARYGALNSSTGSIVSAYQEQQKARRKAGDTTAQKNPVLVPRAALAGGLDGRPLPQRALTDLESANLTRAVMSERQLNEEMVEFWENHFSVYAGKGQVRLYLPAYDRDVIRPRALGKFRDLLGAVAESPAMLFFLDNWQSQADSLRPTLVNPGRGGRGGAGGFGVRPFAPPPPRLAQAQALLAKRPKPGLNENYARELMELHTMGVDGGYTQHDVTEVARAFTGWSMQPARDGSFIFRAQAHDAGQKVVLGHVLPAGRGIQDGNDVLDIVAHLPATATFITTKLARHFISDDPPKTVVDKCSAVFTATDGDIRQTLGCVITSREFFSRVAYRAKVKSPFEVVASGLRAVNAQIDATPRAVQAVASLGAPMYGHQTPEGWPDRAESWMNTGAIVNRINFGLTLAGNRIPGITRGPVPALQQLQGAPRDQQVDGVVNSLFGGAVSPETREILMSGNNPVAAALDSTGGSAQAMNSVMADDAMTAGRGGRGAAPPRLGPNGAGGGRGAGGRGVSTAPVNLQGLAQVIGLALGAPEFQRR